jgi:hypothetical protein
MKLSDIKDPRQREFYARAAATSIFPKRRDASEQSEESSDASGLLHPAINRNGASPIAGLERGSRGKSFARSPLELLFLERWKQAGGLELEEEVILVPDRLFRVDFLHRASETIIEVQGYKDHASRKGFERDAEKFFLLQIRYGYRVVILTRTLINSTFIAELVELVKREGR